MIKVRLTDLLQVFDINSATTPRYDLWFTIDGDPNNDGSRIGSCMVATPYIDVDDEDSGEIPLYQLSQISTISIGCRWQR